jgi:hypothetical protein
LHRLIASENQADLLNDEALLTNHTARQRIIVPYLYCHQLISERFRYHQLCQGQVQYLQLANAPVHPPRGTFRTQKLTLYGRCATGLLGRFFTVDQEALGCISSLRQMSDCAYPILP